MKKIISLMLIAASLCSCSVIMASKKSGTEFQKIQSFRTRGEFLAAEAQVVATEKCENGGVIEVYQYKNATGSISRAFMHGLLDVWTVGLWEVVGTPLEGCLNEAEYFTLRVTYDENDRATRVELL